MEAKRFRERKLWAKMKPVVKALRQEATPAERVLWDRLRAHRTAGLKSSRQHPIGRSIADFCCPQHKIVVAVDGPIRLARVDEDRQRQMYLEPCGFRVLRFTHEEVVAALDGTVAKNIALAERMP